MLRIGLAKGDITPRANMAIAGYGKRMQPSLGVSDPIHATVLVAESQGAILAVVDCDLVGVGLAFADEVRRLAFERSGIPEGHIMICCTHSHYGPNVVKPRNDDWSIGDYFKYWGTDGWGRPEDVAPSAAGVHEAAYRECLKHQLADLVQMAARNLQPARMRIGIGQSDIGVCRRVRRPDGSITFGENPDMPIDRTLGVCCLETPEGNPLAAVVSFATHPVSQDPQLRMFSADYVGFVRQVVQQVTGATCLFLQGASGEINPRNAETSHANARTLGLRVGCDAARLWQTAEPAATAPVRAVRRRLTLPGYRGLSEAHAARGTAEIAAELKAARENPACPEALRNWFALQEQKARRFQASWKDPRLAPPPVPTEAQAFRIGPMAWAGVPTELFSELGQQIKRESPFPTTFVVTHANDYFGYLPSPSAFDAGGYEVDQTCAVSREGIGSLLAHLSAMLRELHAEAEPRHESRLSRT